MTVQHKVPAIFMRGGTSKGVFFNRRDLPDEQALWDPIFLAVIGSPDPYGRQLNGMGGGISSLSKVVVIGPSSHPEADVDYTFGQVAVDAPRVFYHNICGNLTSAVGPFAVDEGLVRAEGGEALVRIFNTNTSKIIHARFPLVAGQAAVEGDFVLAGVAGGGARIRLEFKDPGGAGTGRLLPTGHVTDTMDVPGLGEVRFSLVDATNPCAYVRADALGLTGAELPEALEADPRVLALLEAIRGRCSVLLGRAETPEEAAVSAQNFPLVAFVAPPADYVTLSGETVPAEQGDLLVRMISMGRPHRALPLSGSICVAVASRIEGTVVHEVARTPASPEDDVRVAHPSGILPLAATVYRRDGAWHAEEGVVYRTARRLMEGAVLVPASQMPAEAIPLTERAR